MAEDDDPKEYRWETGYEKTWEAIKEDDDGLVDGSIADIIQKAKRKRQALKKGHSRLGMMRHMYVIVDCSESMSMQDLKPTRLLCTAKLLEIFMEEFFDQNPISQMGLIALRGKRAEKICELKGSCRKHIGSVRQLQKIGLHGEPSLQNGLELALQTLRLLPAHASREILVVMGSLTTCDPSDIVETVAQLRRECVRCSVVSLSAEIRVCKYLTQETGGVYGAILDDAHFKDQLLQHIDPPLAAKSQENSLIKMGFPHGESAGEEGVGNPVLTMCSCHVDSADEPARLSATGYHCPQCGSKYCELPIECMACGLTLVSAPHLARSYHHLFPVNHFKEVPFGGQADTCFACQRVLGEATDKNVYLCAMCEQFFCIDCDIFIHDTLHTCIGCTTLPAAVQRMQQVQPALSSSGGGPQAQSSHTSFGAAAAAAALERRVATGPLNH